MKKEQMMITKGIKFVPSFGVLSTDFSDFLRNLQLYFPKYIWVAESSAFASWSNLPAVLIRLYSLVFVKKKPSEIVAGILALSNTPEANLEIP